MTIYKPIKPLADSAVDSAIKLAHGQTLDAKDKVNNGKIDVPSILQEPQAVDKDNLDATIIKDGYHPCEKVYEKVPGHKCPAATADEKRGTEGGRPKTFAASSLAALGLLLSAFVFVRLR